MKITIELDDGVYQAIKSMSPGVDIEMALSEMLRGVVIIMATHPEEFMRAYLEDSNEDKEIVAEHLRKLVPKVIEKATLEHIICEDCGAEIYIPKNTNQVECPKCGAIYQRSQ